MNSVNLFHSLALVGALLLLGCTAANNELAKSELAQNGSPAAGVSSEDITEVNSSDLTQVTIGGINWYVNYDEALQVAKQENKPIWLHFGENPG